MAGEYAVAIPSYRRAATLARKTWPLLAERFVPMDRVTVFVADREDADAYVAAGIPAQQIVIGVPGMGAIRNFIQRHYPEGQELVQIDDDIIDVRQATSPKTTEPVRNLDWMFRSAFQMLHQTDLRLWGIYPVMNPYFMDNKVTTDLRYVIGCLWGCLNTHAEWGSVTLDDKEDYERTIRYYEATGGVLRINYVAPITNYYTEPGGMQVERTEDRITRSAEELAFRYPEFCSLNLGKASGHAELRLRDKRKRKAAA